MEETGNPPFLPGSSPHSKPKTAVFPRIGSSLTFKINTMKKIYFLLSFLLATAVLVSAQTMTVQLSGTVTADSTGAPVANHEVIILSDSAGGFNFYTTRMTNPNGFYDCTIQNVPTGTVITFIVKTRDCNDFFHQETFLSTNSPAVINFVICLHTLNCEAEYTYFQDSTNLLNFHFNSTSFVPSGDTIISYLWEFGDGSANATTQDPWHVFVHPGNYLVCLIIATSTGCTSTVCKVIQAGPLPINCLSWFSYTHDFLTYNFEGHTYSPYPTDWIWNFGDTATGINNTGSGQLAMHLFSSPGTYTVTLQTIDSSGCAYNNEQTIYVHTTVDIDGAVHAGNHFVDHGFIELIRVDSNNVMTVVDSKEFSDSAGMYHFGGVPAGHYYLKAELLPSSAYYGQFAPTYYQEALHWTDADLIELGQPQNPYNFGLKNITDNPTGAGNISGNVSQGIKMTAEGTPAPNVEVLLLDEQSVVRSYTKTDVSGHFEFSNVALGNYIVWPEVAGLLTSPAHITLTTTVPALILPFNMTGTNVIYGINDNLPESFSQVGEIFPNPVIDGHAGISVMMIRDMTIDLVLYNQSGQMIRSNCVEVHKGSNLIRIDTKHLAKGTYYLQLNASAGGKVTRKISISE